MNLWPVLVISGLITFVIRLSFIALVGQRPVPPLARRALRFVPPAVLTAILIPGMLMPAGRLDVSLGNARLLAGLLAILVAWRTRSAVLTIVVGMAALWILQMLI
jgi:branched-subunit amino acid transport protein